MNNGVTKQKIWRDNTSLFIRVMMGIHIFIGYLNVFFALSMCFINLIKSQEIISYIEKYFSKGLVFNKSDYGANFIIEFYYAIGNAKTFHTIIEILLIVAVLVNLGWTMWLHLRKSRVVAVFNFIVWIANLLQFFAIVLMQSGYIFRPISCIYLLILIFGTIVSLGYVRATISYHQKLKEEEFRELDRVRRNKEKLERKEPYQITKPKLSDTYYTMKDPKSNVETIRIDDYIDKRNVSDTQSVYGGEKEKPDTQKSDSSQGKINQKGEDKQKQIKARIRIEKDEDILGKDPDEERFRMENRPLLSNINKVNQEKSENKEVLSEKLLSNSDEITEPEVNPQEIEDTTVQKNIILEEEKNSNNVDLDPQKELVEQEENEVQESIAENETKDSAVENEVEHYEMEDGVKVDTSLGYRRITFDDL